ncbi:hypothetical protein ABKN59_007580 [Abortiporus biennis]
MAVQAFGEYGKTVSSWQSWLLRVPPAVCSHDRLGPGTSNSPLASVPRAKLDALYKIARGNVSRISGLAFHQTTHLAHPRIQQHSSCDSPFS